MFKWLFRKYIRAIEVHQKTISEMLDVQKEQADLLLGAITILKEHEDQIKKLSIKSDCPWDLDIFTKKDKNEKI